MTIVGEVSFDYFHDAQGAHSATYEINFGLRNVYAKVALSSYVEYVRTSGNTPPYDAQFSVIRIKSIKRKRSDGLIEQVDVESNGVYEPNLNSLTLFLYGHDTLFNAIVIIEYWG